AELLPLVASFGNALIDRAVLDAICRLLGVSFWTAMRSNLPGMTAHPAIADLGAFDFNGFLASLSPVATIEARHTVGLVDPITAADQPPGTRVDDGLPETLEEVVARYGQRCFKLKVGGDVRADLDRLLRIASVLDRIEGLHVTIDGNEQYEDVESVLELWTAIEAEPGLHKLCTATLFIEQPIKRQVALARSIAPLARHRPVIIDESDGELDAFPRARSLGYGGVSSKDCKGFYKSIVNLARCRVWNAESEAGDFFMSGEDLTTQAGLAVQQDLALVALLGLADVERNGHHFIDGFAGRPFEESLAFLDAHPDLYHEENRRVRLKIENGRIALGSLDCPGFGSAVVPDLSTTERMPKADWPRQR
ncbi:MAG TPA: enolase C-terminal domain-like protein, partial [Caldimonas sp.]|nr:enolase C-terminal domain-like protein [Caldimonas sp.]